MARNGHQSSRDVPSSPRSFAIAQPIPISRIPADDDDDDDDDGQLPPKPPDFKSATMKYSLAPFIIRRPWLYKIFKPAASWYINAAGYRQMGLRYDDLLEEENDVAQKALKRLNNRESYERIYRIRRAVQCSYQHKLLPKEQWTTTAQDVRYLQPLIDEVAAEKAEKNELDSIAVIRKH